MPSDRVTRILLSKTQLSKAAISELSESQAWQIVSTVTRKRKKGEKVFQVCFTGFRPDEKDALTARAKEHGLTPVTKVTKNLKILVCGDTPGPKKLEEAAEQGATLMDLSEFEYYLSSLPVPEA